MRNDPRPDEPTRTASATDETARHEVPAEERFHLPHPTYWPAVFAAGLTLLAFGIVSNAAFSAIGALLVIGALIGWIGDLRGA